MRNHSKYHLCSCFLPQQSQKRTVFNVLSTKYWMVVQITCIYTYLTRFIIIIMIENQSSSSVLKTVWGTQMSANKNRAHLHTWLTDVYYESEFKILHLSESCEITIGMNDLFLLSLIHDRTDILCVVCQASGFEVLLYCVSPDQQYLPDTNALWHWHTHSNTYTHTLSHTLTLTHTHTHTHTNPHSNTHSH